MANFQNYLKQVDGFEGPHFVRLKVLRGEYAGRNFAGRWTGLFGGRGMPMSASFVVGPKLVLSEADFEVEVWPEEEIFGQINFGEVIL